MNTKTSSRHSMLRNGSYRITCTSGNYIENGIVHLQHGAVQGASSHNEFSGKLDEHEGKITGILHVTRTGPPEHMGLGRFKTAPLKICGHTQQDGSISATGTANGHTVILIQITLQYKTS